MESAQEGTHVFSGICGWTSFGLVVAACGFGMSILFDVW